MSKVVGVVFKNKGRQYNFSVGPISVEKNDNVIVETEKGTQFGTVVTDIFEVDEKKSKTDLKPVIRVADKEDIKQNESNFEEAEKALKKARQVVEKLKLNMYIIDASYTFEREQLIFHFLADQRIDFRDLVKELASIYHTRIDLRQIGVRDKAREIGGYGICGCELCCTRFKTDFDAVSINMAKNQNIALNPTKINGVCGRLLCCLKYEDDVYTEARKGLPNIGSTVKTKKGEGVVRSVDILNRKYTALVNNELVDVDLNERN